jgi:hypothetical protein
MSRRTTSTFHLAIKKSGGNGSAASGGETVPQKSHQLQWLQCSISRAEDGKSWIVV